MKDIIILFFVSFLLLSCNFAKQEMELGDLKRENRELKFKIKKYQFDSIIRREKEVTDPYKLRAIRLVDSLKFNDPKTFFEIEKIIETNGKDIQ